MQKLEINEKNEVTGLSGNRTIPDIEVPPEYTNAALRDLLREAHSRNRALTEALQEIAGAYGHEKFKSVVAGEAKP